MRLPYGVTLSTAAGSGWFLFVREQSQQQPKQNERRLINLIFAGRNRNDPIECP